MCVGGGGYAAGKIFASKMPSLTYVTGELLAVMVDLFQAIEKIREFILQKIYQFRKPMTNYQIPQNALLKLR